MLVDEVAEVAKEVVEVAKELSEVAKQVVEMAKKVIRVVKEVIEIHAMVAATKPTTIQSVVLKAGMLTDEAIRNGALKKVTKKRGNNREPSRDRNAKNDKKRSRTRRAFAITINLVRKEYTGMDWLSRLKAEIIFHEKVVRILLPSDEILRVLREKPEEKGEEQERAFQTLKDKLCNASILALLNGLKDFVVYYDASCLGLGIFSKLVKPLTIMTQKNKEYVWGEEQDRAFQTLKDKLCNASILALLDELKDFVVYYDASCLGLGCVLMQRAILLGPDNRLPMLEKDTYDTWKSRMELYIMNRQHGRMILEFVDNGPLIWPSIEENRVKRPKRYSELSATEAIQADCHVNATNIILQGLPPEEMECKLYDEFDKFAYKKEETLHEFYLRFSLLLNDMNIYNIKLEQFQVNIKFLNTLPPEWSKFVTDVKLVRDLHTTNVDQLHAHLGQHEFHANEVCLMHECNSNPLVLVATHQITQSPYQTHQHSYQNTQFQPQVSSFQSLQYGSPYQSPQYSHTQSSTPLSITYPPNDFQSLVHHNVYTSSSSIPQVEYASSVNQQLDFSQPYYGLIVLVLQKGDDPIDAINHMMSFLTAVVTSWYPHTNNQLRNSSNPRQQATINNRRVTIQPIQGRHTSLASSTSRTYTSGASGSGASGNNYGKQRTAMSLSEQSNIKNQSETKRTSDSNIIPYSQYVSEPQQKAVQNSNSPTQQDALILSVIEQLKTQLVNYDLAEVHNHDNVNRNLINQAMQAMSLSEQSNIKNQSETKRTSDSNIIPYSQYVSEPQQKAVQNSNSPTQQDALILSVIEQLKTQLVNFDYAILNKLSQDFETRFVPQTELSAEQAFWSYNYVNSPEPTPSTRPTQVEIPKELPKVSRVNTSLKKLKQHLASFDVVVKERTTTTAITEGTWGFEHTKACFRDEIIPFVKALKDLFNSFDQFLVDELSKV
nr:putative reverse transcriptase domain-containing protein [Tanacetum cinerariifolium]